jgi:hypothetical protein
MNLSPPQTCVWSVAVMTLIVLPLSAQAPQERDAVENADREPLRDGGIPREELLQEEREQQEGTEEGAPRLRPDVEDRRVQPQLLPPERDQWKLGVYAYNTDTGVVVTRVVPGSAAARQGLERGDRIVTVDGFQVGYVGRHLYPLGYELQRQAGSRGNVTLLIQNVRTDELLNRNVRLDRGGRARETRRDRFRP